MRKRILVVDNEEYIQEVTKICLETVAGWDVLTASSGLEGIQTAELEQPDAILLDVMMPDMDGIATFNRLRENPATQHIPVMFFTAKAQVSDYQYYEELGIKAAIAKPFEPMVLAKQVAQALGWNFVPC
ncbi:MULTISPECIES: response regulator [Leptolyngbya]|jgi:CheY-like chemotaxis protein|uniref:Response regulator receiver domain protein n=2 Tax=Leptolyngbya boryana TaxID=1184 RepID=A0A1Z4J9L7_LEPBY|nr:MULTISPECIES: response regulator [Leptolyngbya]BAY53368.1 response regulator receiver domain protein [Leptolyngbya boryana NIES-2135]MBD1855141.1 response regulator [Leptolyngbya sp. FACHB-1624]MBD2366767.1 response regulator [Leptolyngbya sp. FACHB-161]MBD2373218.1 response regulator [Leptolyngbya sp. FACHB-238]MBD2397619.1 response regulator [Leptolyngbya sp. FACHB-239]